MNQKKSSRGGVRNVFAILLGIGAGGVLLSLFIRGETKPWFRAPEEPDVIVTTGTIKAKDALATLLHSRGVKNEFIPAIEKSLSTKFNPRGLQPGASYEIVASTDGVFKQFVYHKSAATSFVVTRSSANGYFCEAFEAKTNWVEKRISGRVNDNLYKDLLAMGYEEPLVAGLVDEISDDIFAWRIDFFTEQRPGDTFEILFEQEFVEGSVEPLSNGRPRILAARYVGQDTKEKNNLAFRYTEPGGKRADYYDQYGASVRRAFLRAPFTRNVFRISSNFSKRRMHPILRVYRPHHGTDYAAAVGTPVASIGKGTVVRAGNVSGYGRCVDIRHNARYTSRYGHLSKIAVRRGQSVSQGQYIGTVGSSGLSTGPHLHFEMLADGVQTNFLTMPFQSAASVKKSNMSDFSKVRADIMNRLNTQLSMTSNGQ